MIESKAKIFCQNEYDSLKKVLMCPPQHMTIREPIHQDHSHPHFPPIQINKALKQHSQLQQVLTMYGTDVILLEPESHSPEQVFTRDIGFVIGEKLFVPKMKSEFREDEDTIFQSWLKGKEIPYYYLQNTVIEGGDVIVDVQSVFVGMSSRTEKGAVDDLQNALKNYEIIPLQFHEKYLHLDCVFNIVSSDVAIIYKAAFDKEVENFLKTKFDLINVPENEQLNLASNVISIGNKTIISIPDNKIVNNELRLRGFEVVEVEFSEMIKAGGSFRCCTLPLIRN